MKITVWGGAGFLGSHVCDALTDAGFDITIADVKESQWKKGNQNLFIGNILNKTEVLESIKNADFVFNFAGIADIQEANKDPFRSAQINILGNMNLLNACVESKVKRYIFASTLYVYSKVGGFYRCSKQACEGYIEEYQRQFNLNFNILRFGSLYGLRCGENNAIYRFIKEAFTQKKITYFGKPDALREYIHVADAANLCTEILDNKYINHYITITGQQSKRVSDILNMIQDMMGEKIKFYYKTDVKNSHYGVTPYAFSPKLGRIFSPKHHIDLGQGLLQIMDVVHNEIKHE